VAHSGTVAGLIFDPRRAGIAERIRECVRQIEQLGLTLTALIGAEPAPTASTQVLAR
jgi:uncharacterized protein involved in propanediol utilization